MKKLTLLTFMFLLFISCENDYTYVFHYNQIDTVNGIQHKTFDPEIIKAKNDTIAFTKAYEKYFLSKKSLENSSKKMKYLNAEALRFEIRNKKNKDFYYFSKLNFTQKIKDSIEKKFYKETY